MVGAGRAPICASITCKWMVFDPTSKTPNLTGSTYPFELSKFLDFKFLQLTAIIAAGRTINACTHVGLSSSVVEQRTCNAQVVSSILTGGSLDLVGEGFSAKLSA